MANDSNGKNQNSKTPNPSPLPDNEVEGGGGGGTTGGGGSGGSWIIADEIAEELTEQQLEELQGKVVRRALSNTTIRKLIDEATDKYAQSLLAARKKAAAK